MKEIDPKYYRHCKVSGSTNPDEIITLTEKEFKEGKQGYVWLDNETGKVKFKEDGDK